MYSKEECHKWLTNPLKNPKTQRPIKLNGPVYKKIMDACADKLKTKKSGKKVIKYTKKEDVCKAFSENDKKNPKTGANIKKNGPTYKKLVKLCQEDKSKETIKKKTEKKSVKKEKVSEQSEVCQLFNENKETNPMTGRKIKMNGPTFNKLINMCQNVMKLDTPLPKEMSNKQLNMIIRKVAKPKGKLLAGTALIEYLCLMYLMTKHSNNCAPVIKKVPVHNKWINLEIYQLIIMVYNAKYKGYVPKTFFQEFNKCKKRFVITILRIEHYHWAHANALIYDRKHQTLERFEPYGHTSGYNSTKLDHILLKMFEKSNIPVKKYIKPLEFCPRIAFQSLEKNSKTNKLDPRGFCSYWSTWYMDMRLSNPDLDRKELVKQSINLIKKDYDGFKEYIRSYAVFINHIERNIEKYLKTQKNLTIDKKRKEIQNIVAKLFKQTTIV